MVERGGSFIGKYLWFGLALAIAFVCTSFVSAYSAPKSAGEKNAKLVGGAVTDKFKETVRLTYLNSKDELLVCTGVLVAEDAVLTAGHCTCGVWDTYRLAIRDSAGQFSLLEKIARPIRYLNFSCSADINTQAGRDLALIRVRSVLDNEKLEKIFNVSLDDQSADRRFPPISSLYGAFVAGSQQLKIAGFGKTESGQFPTQLLDAEVNVGSFFCLNGFILSRANVCAHFREFVLSNFISVARNAITDTCGGDSGGPVFWSYEVNGVKRYSLVGLTSRELVGVPHLQGLSCGGGGVYTALGHDEVLSWLDSNGVRYSIY